MAFWGAIWFGYGIVLWRASSHIRGEPELFRLLCRILLLSGLARVGAAVAYGLLGAVLTGAMTVELLGGFGLLLWHNTKPPVQSASSTPADQARALYRAQFLPQLHRPYPP